MNEIRVQISSINSFTSFLLIAIKLPTSSHMTWKGACVRVMIELVMQSLGTLHENCLSNVLPADVPLLYRTQSKSVKCSLDCPSL